MIAGRLRRYWRNYRGDVAAMLLVVVLIALASWARGVTGPGNCCESRLIPLHGGVDRDSGLQRGAGPEEAGPADPTDDAAYRLEQEYALHHRQDRAPWGAPQP